MNAFAYAPSTTGIVEMNLLHYNLAYGEFEDGPYRGVGVNGVTKALAKMVTDYLHPSGEELKDLAPSLVRNLTSARYALKQCQQDAQVADQVDHWQTEVHRTQEALELAPVMDRFVTGLDLSTVTADTALPEGEALRAVLKDGDEPNVLNLLFRYADTLVDYELQIDENASAEVVYS